MTEKDASERFVSQVRSAHFTILRRVKSYVDVLRGTASLFQTTPDITREQFHRYVNGLNLQEEFPGVQAVNYALLVKDAERPAFEKRMAAELVAEGIPNFKIKPPGRRDEYLVVTYIEPDTIGREMFGNDLLRTVTHSGIRTPAILDNSRDTGGLAASGRPMNMNLPQKVAGLGMRLPVYQIGMPTETVEQRRAAYIGSVGLAFSIETLMNGVLEELPVSGMRMGLIGMVDGDVPGDPKRRLLLYDSQMPHNHPASMPPVADDEFYMSLPVEFSNRNWEVEFRIKKADLYTGFDAYVPWMTLAAGFVTTALVYALFQALALSRQTAVRLADRMTMELRASKASLQISNSRLRDLAAHAEEIKESERKRIAREIHDDLGQNLLALRIEVDMLASRTAERHPLLNSRVRWTLQQIDTTIGSVRQIINDLRPNVLDLGLNAAVDWQIAQFERSSGIPCELVENDQNISISDSCATALFRILQESLTNVARHANATRVRVELLVDTDRVSMMVSDNGRGLQPGGRHKPGSFGLVGIEERVRMLGGVFRVNSMPGAGTTINVSIPLNDTSIMPPFETDLPEQNPVVTAII
ncbi:histidine kinase [Massilia horti]|uniref:Histidine kinase n=2 Tax=Massilia horti TaxID=2562153 RepID=A0A4Y9T630_9BURK|nr:histidine kinase [Massilia horti]